MLLPIIILLGIGGAAWIDRPRSRARFGGFAQGITAVPDPFAPDDTVRVQAMASDIFALQVVRREGGTTLPAHAKANLKLEVDGLVVEDVWLDENSWSHGEILEWSVPFGSTVRLIVDGRLSTPPVSAVQGLVLDSAGGRMELVPV